MPTAILYMYTINTTIHSISSFLPMLNKIKLVSILLFLCCVFASYCLRILVYSVSLSFDVVVVVVVIVLFHTLTRNVNHIVMTVNSRKSSVYTYTSMPQSYIVSTRLNEIKPPKQRTMQWKGNINNNIE